METSGDDGGGEGDGCHGYAPDSVASWEECWVAKAVRVAMAATQGRGAVYMGIKDEAWYITWITGMVTYKSKIKLK